MSAQLTLFFGRFHPVLVHLPIGLIVVLALLEPLARFPRFRPAKAATGLLLTLAVPLSALTALCGWLLSSEGGYDPRLLQWHQWTGIGTALACALAALLYRFNLRRAYQLCLGISLGALVVASHLGGSLTHGSDYLVHYAPRPFGSRPVAPASGTNAPALEPSQRLAFASLVQPFLDQRCVSCHGPDKTKGGLRLDSFAALLKGGEAGPAVVPGKPGESPALQRLLLPLSHDDHMPPEGKPQPTAEEIAAFQCWVEAGAGTNQTLADLPLPPHLLRGLAGTNAAPAPATTVAPKPLQEILPTAAALATDLSLPISALSETEAWLQANAAIAGTNFGDADLAKLAKLGPNLRWLDLAGTRVSDAGLATLTSFPNLLRLHLQRTAVTDAGLGALAPLTQLEYLNLYATSVTDQGLARLSSLPRLKRVYLWQTRVSPAAAKRFLESRVDPAQRQAWEAEIARLQAKINEQQMVVDLGSVSPAPHASNASNAAPMNVTCPVSGNPADPAKTVLLDGRLVAFCCNDCKAKFQQDPKPFLAKLSSPTNPPASQEAH